jgi:hypothetical protein
MSSSDDDDDASPPFVSTQQFGSNGGGCTGLDLDEALRTRGDMRRRERAAELERRRHERRRRTAASSAAGAAEEEDGTRGDGRGAVRRRRGRTYDDDDDDDDTSGGDSADLLADDDDAKEEDGGQNWRTSTGGGPTNDAGPSPPRTARISNRDRRRRTTSSSSSSSSSPPASSYGRIRGDVRTRVGKTTSSPAILKRGREDVGSFGIRNRDSPPSTGNPPFQSPRNRVSFRDRDDVRTTRGLERAAERDDASSEYDIDGKRMKGGGGGDGCDDDDAYLGLYGATRMGRERSRGRESSRDGATTSMSSRRRFGTMMGDSSDDSDDGGGMLRAMRARQAALAAAGAAAEASGGAKAITRVASATSERRSRPIGVRQNVPDSSDESNGGIAEAMRRALRDRRAREEEEEERRRARNPMAVERREREEREGRWREQQLAGAERTRAGAGGLEGTEILVLEEDAEAKSISEIGDENIRYTARRGEGRGGGGGSAAGGDADVDVGGGDRQSRGPWKNRAKCGSDDDDDDSPLKRRRAGYKSSFRKQGDGMRDLDDDGLWDDSDGDMKNEKKNNEADDENSDNVGRKKRGRSRQKEREPVQPKKRSISKAASNSPPKTSGSSDDDSNKFLNKNIDEPSPKKNGRRRRSTSINSLNETTDCKSSGRWASRYEIDEDEKCDLSDDLVNRRTRQLKPDFSEPKMGAPGPLVPFILSQRWKRGDPLIGYENEGSTEEGEDSRNTSAPIAHNEDIDQVPASINRYLKGYQRKGIQFMYSSVIHGKGCVLGDDMGLGKTVQVISLIAALLKKKGNGLDELEIKQHSNKLKKALQAREESKRQALLTGFGIASVNETVELPRFAPILIIVPSSVVENWQVRQCLRA